MTEPIPQTVAEPVQVQFEDVLNRVTQHHADRNAQLVSELAMAQAEVAALRTERATLIQQVAQLRAGQPEDQR